MSLLTSSICCCKACLSGVTNWTPGNVKIILENYNNFPHYTTSIHKTSMQHDMLLKQAICTDKASG